MRKLCYHQSSNAVTINSNHHIASRGLNYSGVHRSPQTLLRPGKMFEVMLPSMSSHKERGGGGGGRLPNQYSTVQNRVCGQIIAVKSLAICGLLPLGSSTPPPPPPPPSKAINYVDFLLRYLWFVVDIYCYASKSSFEIGHKFTCIKVTTFFTELPAVSESEESV